MTLSAFGVFLYTTVGGVIGAGLTQYITHLRDRRTARAAIIEKVAAAESEYALWTSSTTRPSNDQENADLSKINAALASVEAACLIAGVPRANVMTYVVSRQIGAKVALFSRFALWTLSEVDRRRLAVEEGVLDEGTARIDEILSLLEDLKSVSNELGELMSHLDNIVFDELSRSIWHPFIVQFRKGQLHKLQQDINQLERKVRSLDREYTKLQTVRAELESQRRT